MSQPSGSDSSSVRRYGRATLTAIANTENQFSVINKFWKKGKKIGEKTRENINACNSNKIELFYRKQKQSSFLCMNWNFFYKKNHLCGFNVTLIYVDCWINTVSHANRQLFLYQQIIRCRHILNVHSPLCVDFNDIICFHIFHKESLITSL